MKKENKKLDAIGASVDAVLPEGSSFILVYQSPANPRTIIVHTLDSDQDCAEAIRDLAKNVNVAMSDA